MTAFARALAFVLHAVLASAFHRLATLLLALVGRSHPVLAMILGG